MKKLLLLLIIVVTGCSKDSTCVPKPITKKVNINITFVPDSIIESKAIIPSASRKLDGYTLNIPFFNVKENISIDTDYTVIKTVLAEEDSLIFNISIPNIPKFKGSEIIFYVDTLIKVRYTENLTLTIPMHTTQGGFYLYDKTDDMSITGYTLNGIHNKLDVWYLYDVREVPHFLAIPIGSINEINIDIKNTAGYMQAWYIYTVHKKTIFQNDKLKIFNTSSNWVDDY